MKRCKGKMYSSEIKQFLYEHSNTISREEYKMLTDIQQSPQIKKIKYDAFNNIYEMETADGFYFRIVVE